MKHFLMSFSLYSTLFSLPCPLVQTKFPSRVMDILKASKELVAEVRDEIRRSLMEVQEDRVKVEDACMKLRELIELSNDRFQRLDLTSEQMSGQLKALVLAIEAQK